MNQQTADELWEIELTKTEYEQMLYKYHALHNCLINGVTYEEGTEDVHPGTIDLNDNPEMAVLLFE